MPWSPAARGQGDGSARAACYHSPIYVAVGVSAALWTVAAISVASGQTRLRLVTITTIGKVTAAVLVALAAYTGYSAFR